MNLSNNIIAIAGGKGGIGKSVISTNLAVGLALGGQEVILVDTDFGASNLHALLGISHPPTGFEDLLKQNGNPQSLLLETGVSNLKFVSAAGDYPGSANIDIGNMSKVVDFIKNLQADSIILDLGPGTHFNVLDFFNTGNHCVAVTTPEITSVMNTFSFLKATIFRRLSLKFNDTRLMEMADFSLNPEANNEYYSIDLLKEKAEEICPEEVETLESTLNSFKPYLIVNRVRKKSDLNAGGNLQLLTKKYLNVDLNHLGYIVESDQVRESVEEMVPFLIQNPQSKPSLNLQSIISTLMNADLQLVKKDGMILVSKQVPLSPSWKS